MFARFLFAGLALLALLALLLKSLILLWSPASFAALSSAQQLEAIVWGFRFDLAAACLVWAPAALLCWLSVRLLRRRRLSWLWWWAPALLLAAMQLGDLMYFDNSGRHVGYEIRELTREFAGLFDTALKQYSLPMLGLLAVGLATALLCRRGAVLQGRLGPLRIELPLLLALLVAAVGIRGSLTELPMKPDRAYDIGNPQQALLSLNPAYAMLSGLLASSKGQASNPLYRQLPAPSSKALALLEPQRLRAAEPYQAPTRQVNVVLMLLESWPAEVMHSYNPAAPTEPAVTPNFDALHAKGLRTDGLLAGGRRTVEGFFSALCSYQNPLEAGVPNTALQSLPYHCLPELLSQAGWSTAVFQGMHKGETGSFAQQLGTQHSYGKLEMPPAQVEKNSWGYQDPDLYRFVVAQAKRETAPFFYMINNTTTHDDQLPPGEPWVFGKEDAKARQLSVLHYADKALGDFIRAFEQANIGPTLFVITADHTAGERSGHLGRYWIPFLLYATDGSVPARHVPGIGAQQDIAPTIMGYLGGRAPWFAGHSLLSQPPQGAGYATSGSLGWVSGKTVIEYPLQHPDQLTCYDWQQDLAMTTPQPCPAQASTLRDLSWASTWYQQSLLFQGQTREFGRIDPASLLRNDSATQTAGGSAKTQPAG